MFCAVVLWVDYYPRSSAPASALPFSPFFSHSSKSYLALLPCLVHATIMRVIILLSPCPLDRPLTQISGGFVGIVKSVKCPQGHVLQLSDRDTGWSCDGRRDDGGCRKESMPPGRRPNRYRCQSCDYDLCDACYEAKGQGTNPCERLFGRRKEKSDF